MAQFQWTVLGVTGKKYNVGLYHGDKSGHLLVHCNGNILVTEFYVKETKNYSFFLDDELYELLVEKHETQFGYSLNPNKTADTPMNRQIWKRDRKNLLQAIVFFGGFFLLIIGLAFAIPKWQSSSLEKDKQRLLETKGHYTTARFMIDSTDLSIQYFYVAGEKSFSKKLLKNKDEQLTVLPLENGDEFELKYFKDSPTLHEILWNKPTEKQIVKYKNRTGEVHQTLHSDFSKNKISCEVGLAFQIDSIRGLAYLFYQNVEEIENAVFNKKSYLRFIRNEPFRKLAAENCWH